MANKTGYVITQGYESQRALPNLEPKQIETTLKDQRKKESGITSRVLFSGRGKSFISHSLVVGYYWAILDEPETQNELEMSRSAMNS